MISIPEAKKILRAEIREYIKSLSPASRTAADQTICRAVKALPEYEKAGSVMAYAPMPDEVNIWPVLESILADKKLLILPRVDLQKKDMYLHQISDQKKDLTETGYAGIREPAPQLPQVSPEDIDLVLVPGRAFDIHGRRLGRGGGYYDRFLEASGAVRVSPGYEGQIVAEVPTDKHDLPVQVVVTPGRIIRA